MAMQCQHPECPNPAQPGIPLPLCPTHAPQFVVGVLFPPDQFMVLDQFRVFPGHAQESSTEATADQQPPAADAEEELFGPGHDSPPWGPHPPWPTNGNGGRNHA
jgi:hypothetical protein